ncbi:MAG TPA: leucyl aminopeptidase family protein [Streptosporangiaceae bacterium]|nr:leucyl aminopeptidase family protein [Streptosporangiaceae bacterium]
MPVTSTVTALSLPGARTVGDYLRAIAAGSGEASGIELADVLVVGVALGGEVAADEELDSVLGTGAAAFVTTTQLTGKAGQAAQAVGKLGDALIRVIFLGVADRSVGALRRAGGDLGRLVRPGELAVTDLVTGLSADQVAAFAEGILLGSYRYSEKSGGGQASTKGQAATNGQTLANGPAATDGKARKNGTHVRLLAGEPDAAGSDSATTATTAVTAAIERAATVAGAVALARDLTNTPSLRKNPQWLADAAVSVARETGLEVTIRTEQELANAGFGGICAVGQGSARPPRLIELRYAPTGAKRHVVLVGKGITFDSGGLSLKPNDGMKLMKTDMAGGAAVIAVMSALARLGVATRVTGLVSAAENLPSGSAFRPGDVITQFGGKTTEVLNTDAEGRLVLADAIAYADAELEPDQIVDLATLTGAARIALGGSRAALYSTSDELAASLAQAGEVSGERLWRMPLPDDYVQLLESDIADQANVSPGEEGGGSITAALFLREFSGGRPWAHLDIAGAARSSGDDGEVTSGGTGFGTRLLLRWLS